MAKRNTPSDEQGQDNEDDNVNDDSFGLPDLDYKPLEQQEQTTQKEERKVEEPVGERPDYETKKETNIRSNYTSSYSTYMEEENKSKTPVIIGVVVAVAVVVFVALFYFFVYKPGQDKKEMEAKIAADQRAKQEQEIRQRQLEEEAARKRVADSLAAIPVQPKEGTIETLTDRTQRYYVVITSAIDGDLVMDYAKKLSAQGVSTKIIPPFGKYKFSRLAIGDHDTFANAQAAADGVKAEYGGAVWVLKF